MPDVPRGPAVVMAVGKFNTGTKPFIFRHRIGKGIVIVNAWTNNIFRDSDIRQDYGGWDYDFILGLAIEDASSPGASSISEPAAVRHWQKISQEYMHLPPLNPLTTLHVMI